MVLKNGGIKKEYLASIIYRELDKYYDGLLEILQKGDSAACRTWIRRIGDFGYTGTKITDGFPPDKTEQIKLLLDAGFLPSKLYFLRTLFELYLRDFLESLECLKIKIPQSTYAYCIADPYGVLKEDEIHLAFGECWDDDSGDLDLDGIDVLVARAPAHLPADIQKRRAVFHPALRHLKNVAIFPTTGDVPLASLLSGGDYDGDEVWVCWDPELVSPFHNQPSHEIPQPEKYGLIKISKPLGNTPFDEFMAKAFHFNLSPNTLGLCTNEHERYCYSLGGIGSPNAVDFSCLLSHLADTRKSGYEYPPENRRAFRKTLGKPTSDNPAYKDSDISTPKPDDIIDYLKFQVIETERKRILARLNNDCPSINICRTDRDLVAIWKKAWDLANYERDVKNSTILLDTIQGIRKKVKKVFEDWNVVRDKLSTEGRITLANEFLMAIRAPHFEHDRSIIWRFSEYEWQTFLASCAYEQYSEKPFPWYATAKVLCGIKCTANGQCRYVTPAIYQLLDVNNSRAKKVEADRRKAEAEEYAAATAFLYEMEENAEFSTFLDEDDGGDRW
ncbi:RNA-directed RNA polymerase [Arthroderma uncinatum]|uniref:RNA-directed RNA polymerase n=1 Tax=Arthroderma uncinatum TaxID=74035 RepID=UPI00144AE329|nr:RNA-directed RNA polymerase [Arthroderma uncinatum]KAF3479669.1 RNA-directed RNA polymerase [Arthroderma uncinatum]